ncbi:MAG: ATP-binding protein [Candidatus Binataceae bacterium]
MIDVLILAIIIFALVQYRRCKRMDRWHKRDKWSRRWERWEARDRAPAAKWDKWSRHWQGWERWASDARHQAANCEDQVANQSERAGTRLRGGAESMRANDERSRPGETERERDARVKSEDEHQAYERARKRAAQQAGFYAHLMWYGVVIGSCLILNLIVSPGFEWWIFPAVGWGIGLASHFGAVYGWHWIHERVFEPAIKREVQREVTLEKEAMRTEKQASLDELTASFAHEIRNPIAAAKSLVQQMGEDPRSNENVEYAKVALDELARVERSVSHLLKYAKEEDYHFDNVNLAAVLDQALTQMRGKLGAAHVTLSRSYIGGPTVRADADKLRQVFTNIIDNAIDAMHEGERRLELGIVRLYASSATVVIRDNGCGIPEDKLTKIFNPFYTTKQNGTGLGMGIAKKVMDAHHGRIEVRSEAGVGTEIRLTVPVPDAARTASDERQDGAGQGHAATAAPLAAAKEPLANPLNYDVDGGGEAGFDAVGQRR